MTNKDWLLLGALALVFGTAFYFIEVALEDLGVLGVVWARVTLAGLILTVWAFARGERFPTSWSVWGLLVFMGFFNNALPFSLITWAQTELTGGLTSIFMSAAPLFTILLAHFVTHDEKITRPKIIGIILGMSGVVILIGPAAVLTLNPSSIWQLAAVSGALCYAIAGIAGKRLHNLSNTVASASMLLAASVMMLPVVLIYDNPIAAHWTTNAMLSIVGLASISTALAYLLYFQLLRTVGASNMLLVTILAPVSAIGLGVMFLDETVTVQMLLGAVVIGAGLMIIDGRVWRKLRRARQAT